MEHKIARPKWEGRFWEDFPIPYQDSDPDVDFANVSDAARALVKARNWSATIAARLADITRSTAECKSEIAERNSLVLRQESRILARHDLPSSVTKNKEAQRSFSRRQANAEELALLNDNEQRLTNLQSMLILLQGDHEAVEVMRRALEKSSDWLVQYVNWHKFEARMLD